MTINLMNLIDKYILGRLQGKKLADFQKNIERSPELAFEVQLNTDIAEAIMETDVINLRASMRDIFNTSETVSAKKNTSVDKLFDLSQNLEQTSYTDIDLDELDIVENSLQFIHLENHKKAQSERVHVVDSSTENQSDIQRTKLTDNELWKEISAAVKESDVIDLRKNLKDIMSSGISEISDFEIDQYLDNDLSPESMMEIGRMIEDNEVLKTQINLHKDINNALEENDINELRANLGSIIEEEQSVSYSEIKRMDEYLLNYLDDKEFNEFEELMEEDLRLKAETELNAEINNAIMETDVMNLRASLQEISEEGKSETKIRQFIPSHIKKSPTRLIGAAASVAAVVSVGAMTLLQQKTSSEALYHKAYRPYEATGLYRSSVSLSPEIVGVDLYNNQKYLSALEQFDVVLTKNPEHPMCNFYSGLSYQELQEYNKAITAYQKVIDEKDNLFIEQAEWYMALCYLQTDDRKKAYATFNKILDKKGYYSKDVKEIIKKLK